MSECIILKTNLIKYLIFQKPIYKCFYTVIRVNFSNVEYFFNTFPIDFKSFADKSVNLYFIVVSIENLIRMPNITQGLKRASSNSGNF